MLIGQPLLITQSVMHSKKQQMCKIYILNLYFRSYFGWLCGNF